MRLIRSLAYRRMPWQNGGGETAEIAIAPPAAALEDFDWRISMARVDCDGPFSSFAGVDRTLTVIEGAGLRLRVAGREPTELTPSSAPHAFPADVATSAALSDGPITDFNVMTRRGRVTQRVRRQDLSTATFVPTDWPVTLVFCIDGRLQASSGATVLSIRPLDSVLLGPEDAPVHLAPAPRAALLVVEIAVS